MLSIVLKLMTLELYGVYVGKLFLDYPYSAVYGIGLVQYWELELFKLSGNVPDVHVQRVIPVGENEPVGPGCHRYAVYDSGVIRVERVVDVNRPDALDAVQRVNLVENVVEIDKLPELAPALIEIGLEYIGDYLLQVRVDVGYLVVHCDLDVRAWGILAVVPEHVRLVDGEIGYRVLWRGANIEINVDRRENLDLGGEGFELFALLFYVFLDRA